MGDQYDIFFSYAHADKDAVKPLLAALFAQGLRVFHDETDITDGLSTVPIPVRGNPKPSLPTALIPTPIR